MHWIIDIVRPKALPIVGWRPAARQNGVMVRYNNTLYIFGGLSFQNRVNIPTFDIKKGKWIQIITQKQAKRTHQRVGHTVCVFEQMILLFGGKYFNRNVVKDLIGEVQIFDPAINNFQKNKISVLKARMYHTMIAYGKMILVIGGVDNNKNFIEQIEMFNFENRNKSIIQKTQGLIISHHTAQVIKNKKLGRLLFILFGGIDQTQNVTNQLVTGYHIIGNVFRINKVKTIGVSPSPRYMHSMCSLEDQSGIIIIGGRNLQQEIFKDIFVLYLQDMSWVRFSMQGKDFQNRYGHCSVIYNNQIYIFGGVGGKQYIKTQLYTLQFQINN